MEERWRLGRGLRRAGRPPRELVSASCEAYLVSLPHADSEAPNTRRVGAHPSQYPYTVVNRGPSPMRNSRLPSHVRPSPRISGTSGCLPGARKPRQQKARRARLARCIRQSAGAPGTGPLSDGRPGFWNSELSDSRGEIRGGCREGELIRREKARHPVCLGYSRHHLRMPRIRVWLRARSWRALSRGGVTDGKKLGEGGVITPGSCTNRQRRSSPSRPSRKAWGRY